MKVIDKGTAKPDDPIYRSGFVLNTGRLTRPTKKSKKEVAAEEREFRRVWRGLERAIALVEREKKLSRKGTKTGKKGGSR